MSRDVLDGEAGGKDSRVEMVRVDVSAKDDETEVDICRGGGGGHSSVEAVNILVGSIDRILSSRLDPKNENNIFHFSRILERSCKRKTLPVLWVAGFVCGVVLLAAGSSGAGDTGVETIVAGIWLLCISIVNAWMEYRRLNCELMHVPKLLHGHLSEFKSRKFGSSKKKSNKTEATKRRGASSGRKSRSAGGRDWIKNGDEDDATRADNERKMKKSKRKKAKKKKKKKKQRKKHRKKQSKKALKKKVTSSEMEKEERKDDDDDDDDGVVVVDGVATVTTRKASFSVTKTSTATGVIDRDGAKNDRRTKEGRSPDTIASRRAARRPVRPHHFMDDRVACCRDSEWKWVPVLFLVEGDVVALSNGRSDTDLLSSLPLESLPRHEWQRSGNRCFYDEGVIEYRQFVVTTTPATRIVRSALKRSTPRRNVLERASSVGEDEEGIEAAVVPSDVVDVVVHDGKDTVEVVSTKKPTLFRQQLGLLYRVYWKLSVFTYILAIVLSTIQWLLQEIVGGEIATPSLFVALILRPMGALICVVPLFIPALVLFVDSVSTAYVLTRARGRISADRVSDNNVNSRSRYLGGDTDDDEEEGGDDSNGNFQNAEVGVGIGFVAPPVDVVRIAWCRFWDLFGFGSLSSDAQLPFAKTLELVDRLGSVTALCCIDSSVVCESDPLVEEICVQKEDVGDIRDRLIIDLHRDENSASGVRFEDTDWKQHLSSLKPLGLACMLNSRLSGDRERRRRRRLRESPANRRSERDLVNLVCTDSWLSGTEASAVWRVAKELGFRHVDLGSLDVVRQIHVLRRQDRRRDDSSREISPVLSVVAFTDNRTHGKRKDRKKKAKTTHPPLQLFTCGDAASLLERCGYYWNGDAICPLTSRSREELNSTVSRWSVEDFRTTAFGFIAVSKKVALALRPQTVPSAVGGLREKTKETEIQAEKRERRKRKKRKRNTKTGTIGENDDDDDDDEEKVERRGGVKDDETAGEPSTTVLESGVGVSLSATRSNEYIFARELVDPDKAVSDSFASASAAIRSLLSKRRFVFLGITASRVQPRPGMQRCIEAMNRAGIRFVYYSPKSFRKSKILAAKMGLNTGWNTAVSLRDDDDGGDCVNGSGSGRTGSSSSTKIDNAGDAARGYAARLPMGIDAIRTHLRDVDNVPLLVPLFTDCTGPTVKKMMSIQQEHGEVVLAFGSATGNADCFEQADVSFAVATNLFDQRAPASPEAAIRQFIAGINSVAGYQVTLPSGASLSTVNNLLVEGRRLLDNVKQFFVFASIVSTSMVFLALIGGSGFFFASAPLMTPSASLWLLSVPFPLLVLSFVFTPPSASIMGTGRVPQKRTESLDRSMYLEIRSILVRVIFGVVAHSLGVYGWALVGFSSSTLRWTDFFWDGNRSTLLQYDTFDGTRIVQAARSLCLFSLVLDWVALSAGCLFRNKSIFAPTHAPYRNLIWVVLSVMTLTIQGLMSFVLYLPSEFKLHDLSISFWTFVGIGPVVVVIIDEIVKHFDRKSEMQYMKGLRLEFDTRLGMHSPCAMLSHRDDDIIRDYPWYVPPDERIDIGSAGGIVLGANTTTLLGSSVRLSVEPRTIRDVPVLDPRGPPRCVRGSKTETSRLQKLDDQDLNSAYKTLPSPNFRSNIVRNQIDHVEKACGNGCYVPSEILRDRLSEVAARNIHNRECAFCARRGNCLAKCEGGDDDSIVFFSSHKISEDMTEIAMFHPFGTSSARPRSRTAQTRSTILQLAAVKAFRHQDPADAAAVIARSTRECTLWTIDEEDSSRLCAKTHLLTGSPATHATTSPLIPFETSVLAGGEVLLWDAGGSGKTLHHDLKLSGASTIQCDYAHHPRVLCISHSRGIFTYDLRSPQKGCEIVRSFAVARDEFLSSERLGPLRIHPSDPFQVITAGDRDMLLLDIRHGRLPLLRWPHKMDDAPPETIEIVPNVRCDTSDVDGSSSTFVCASSLSLRGGEQIVCNRGYAHSAKKTGFEIVSPPTAVGAGVSNVVKASSVPDCVFGDRHILTLQFLPGERARIPAFFTHPSTPQEVWGPPRPIGLPRFVKTNAKKSDAWPRDPIAGLGAVVRRSDGGKEDSLRLLWLT
eukprot:g1304.t1